MDRWDTALVFSKNNNVCSYQLLDSGPWVFGVFFIYLSFFYLFIFGEGGGGGDGGMYFQPHIKKKDKISCPKMFGFKLIHDVGYLA